MKTILFIILTCILIGCTKINYLPGGTFDTYTEYKDTFKRYINPSINLRAFDEYNSDKIGITDNYFKNSGLSKKIRNSILGAGEDSTYVLYSMENKDGTTFIAATICMTEKSYNDYEKRIYDSIKNKIMSVRYRYFLLETKRETLVHEYCYLKNQNALFNIFDYYIQWSPDAVVRLTVCERVGAKPIRYYDNHWAVERLIGQLKPSPDKEEKIAGNN